MKTKFLSEFARLAYEPDPSKKNELFKRWIKESEKEQGYEQVVHEYLKFYFNEYIPNKYNDYSRFIIGKIKHQAILLEIIVEVLPLFTNMTVKQTVQALDILFLDKNHYTEYFYDYLVPNIILRKKLFYLNVFSTQMFPKLNGSTLLLLRTASIAEESLLMQKVVENLEHAPKDEKQVVVQIGNYYVPENYFMRLERLNYLRVSGKNRIRKMKFNFDIVFWLNNYQSRLSSEDWEDYLFQFEYFIARAKIQLSPDFLKKFERYKKNQEGLSGFLKYKHTPATKEFFDKEPLLYLIGVEQDERIQNVGLDTKIKEFMNERMETILREDIVHPDFLFFIVSEYYSYQSKTKDKRTLRNVLIEKPYRLFHKYRYYYEQDKNRIIHDFEENGSVNVRNISQLEYGLFIEIISNYKVRKDVLKTMKSVTIRDIQAICTNNKLSFDEKLEIVSIVTIDQFLDIEFKHICKLDIEKTLKEELLLLLNNINALKFDDHIFFGKRVVDVDCDLSDNTLFLLNCYKLQKVKEPCD